MKEEKKDRLIETMAIVTLYRGKIYIGTGSK